MRPCIERLPDGAPLSELFGMISQLETRITALEHTLGGGDGNLSPPSGQRCRGLLRLSTGLGVSRFPSIHPPPRPELPICPSNPREEIVQPTPIRDANRHPKRGRHLSVTLAPELHKALAELADDHERSVAGEVRYIIRRISEDPQLLEGG